MKRTGILILSLILLSTLVCGANAEDRRDGGSSLDQGGTYCGGAVVIPGSSLSFTDTGFLDADNDCSNPFGWPYNEVFYTFTPNVTRTFIFKLQLGRPSMEASLRIMANACCAGGTTVAAIQSDMVPADCDTGRTTYLRATLNAGTQYWFHVGDNSTTIHDSHYSFQMLFVDCPRRDTTLAHHTCETAQTILKNDSIMGDSAAFGHADFYQFTLDSNSIVTISEFGRTFGHCNTGFFPLCQNNPLDAHFFVFCSCPTFAGTLLAEAHGELCSTDAQTTLCLPAGGPYFIKIENFNGYSWAGWDYILAIRSVATDSVCPDLPPLCGGFVNFCPGPVDTFIHLNPDQPVPGPQTAQVCAFLNFRVQSEIIVNTNLSAFNRPIVSIGGDTCTACAPTECRHLIFPPIFDQNAWVYDAVNHQWTNTIQPQLGDTGCCICLRLDFILPVELTGFTAVAGDGEVTLNWSTASENQNHHFELSRDGVPLIEIPGAGTSSEAHSYRYSDQGLVNYQVHTYTLVAVGMEGNRQSLGSVRAQAQGGVAVITEYALYQNYPNPFNPTTQITFDLVEGGVARLSVYNLMGQEVAKLVQSHLTLGHHSVTFDAGSLPSGLYVCRLSVNGFTAEKKMLLLK